MNAKNVRKLKDAGLDLAMISVDDYGKGHDNSRKIKGLYVKVLEGIDLCLKNNIKVICCSIATNENIVDGSLERVFEEVRNIGAIPFVNMPVCVGGWGGEDKSLTRKNKAKLN